MSKISELSDGGSLQSTDYLIAVRSGGNVKVRANGAVSGTTGIFSDDLNVGSGKFFVDVSTGNVGIGTSSPTGAKLQIDAGGSLAGVRISGITGSNQDFYAVRNGSSAIQEGPNITLQTATGTTYATTMQLGPTGEQLFFNYNGSAWNERMRIDSSGNLLVGTTNAVPLSDDGAVLGASGYVYASRDGDIALFANRLNSDGDIAIFRKDGTTVGSIGTASSKLTVGSGATGVRFNYASLDTIAPWNVTTNAVTDGATDLGYTNARFKDIYLSGGVYLGGTGAANLLDDYEEGTWTGTATAGASTSISVANEFYTKIGNLVTVHFQVIFTGASGSLVVTGLPFTSSPMGVGIGREDATSGYAVYGRTTSGFAQVDLYYAGATGNATPFQVANGDFKVTLTYRTA